MDESESKKSTEGLKMNSPVAKKPKKRSLVERELETNLTQKITSPVAIGDGASTSRYGRARRLKTDTDFCDTDKAVTLMIKSPKIEKSPKVIIEPTVHKMHAVNSPVKHESPKSLSADTKIDSQIENIYSENVSLSRFGSEEKVKTISPAMKYPKVYIRKDLIQNKDSEETPAMIKSIFSPVKSGGKSSNSHLNNILERSSEKYNLNSNSVPQCSTASVVKTLDFDNKKKTRKDTKDSKDTLAKSDLFELEAKCEYQVGDLAWARMGTYPFWPCIITREPQSQMFVRKKLFGRVEHYIIHVTFFGDNGRRSWIVDNMLRKFLGQLEFETARNGFTAEDKKKNSKLYAAFFVSEKKMPLWNVSVEEAEMMLREPKRLRIDILNYMLGKNSAKTCTKQKSGKITRTDSDVSLSESLYDSLFSEDDLKNDDADRSRNKTRNRSLDVSEVVTACLDNMAAKTGITKIQRQSHMDRWLQKAKSKTPEKSHFKIQIPVLRSDKPRQQKSENESKRNSSKRKSSNTTVKEKPYSLRKSACESQNNTLLHYQNEHDYSSNGRVNGNISDKSDTWDSDSENVAKVEFLSDINNEDNKNDVIIEQDINDVMYVDKDIKVNLEISGGDSNTENVQFSKTMSLQEDHNDSGIKNTVQIVAESSIDKVFVVENNDITMSEQDKLNVPEERDDPVYDNIDEKQNKSDDINVSKISVKESDIVDNNIKVDANVDCAMIDSIIQNSNNAMDNSEMVKIRNMENAFLGKHDLGGSDILTVPKSLSNKKIQDVPNDRISPRKNCDLNNISILTNGHSEEDELSLVYEDDDQDLFLNGSLNEEDLVNKSNLDTSNIVGSGSLEDTSNNLSYSNLSENKDSLNVIETSSNKNMFQDSIYTKRRVSKRNVKKSKESNKTYKRSPRLRLQKTDQTKVISVENPKFLKYMEIKQDSVIDENPDLTKEEIVHYLFKTWQYEQGIEQTCQSNELETTPESVEDTNVCNSHYSMEETSQMNYIKAMSEKKCENFPDNTLSTEHTSEAEKLMTVLPENTQFQCVDTNGKYVSQAEECQTRVNITVDTKLSNINTNKIEYTTNVKDVDIKPQSEDIPETRIQETSQVDELKTTEDILDINIREQAIQTNCLDILDDTKMPNMEISTEHESNVNELTSVPELPDITEDSNIQDSFEQTNVPNVDNMEEIVQVQGIKTTDEKLSSVDTNEIQDIMQLSKEKLFSDSIVSEDKFEESETDSQNIDNKVTEAQLSTHLEKDIPLEASFITPEFRNDVSKDSLDLQTGTNNLNGMKSIKNPEFIKYMQLKQDAIIEENPDLSEEEIVQYLYKTWLYEESELAKLTQSEDIEQLQENMDMDEDMDVIDAANGDSEGFETNNANDNLEELKSADAQLDDEDESSQERINILYEVNSDTSTISEVSSKSHKRSLRLKSRPIKQKDQKSMDHPEFLKYLELKQDVIIDENPTLTQDEIVSYLYKTWLYEESEQADKRSLDSIDMTCQVKGLETDYVPQRKTRNKSKKVNGICTNREKELLRELKDLGSDTSSIDSEILVVRPNRKLRPRVIYSPPTSPTMQNGHLDTDRLETAIKGKDIDDISINSECSDEPLHKVKLRSRTKESPKTSNCDGSQENNEIDDLKVINGDPTIFKRKLCLKIRPIAIANDGFNGPKQLMMEINTKEEFDVETSSVNSEISSVSSFSKLMIPTEALESPLNVQQEFIDSINKDDGPGPIINDEIHDETASINSEVLEAPLAKRKQKNTTEKGTRKTKQTHMNDPEFLSYLELKQDALMDEYPQLTQDDIVEYLYKTWLYEESNKSEIKKTDEIEQKNLVKGLNNENSEQPKKVRKKIKTDCTEGTMMDYVTKEKPKRNTVRQYYKEDCSDIEEQIQLFEIFRKKSSTVAKSDKEDPVPEVKTENGEVVTTDKIEEVQEGGTVVDVYDEVEMYFDKLTKPKPSLFKGLVREKVCEICESTGNLVKCKGCSAMFHVDCVKKEKQVVEVQTPSRGRKKKKKPRGRRPKSQDTELDSSHSDDKANISDEIPNISLEEELKFNVVADADNFEAQLAEKMKQMMESNDNNSCDSYSADEINWNNIEAGKCEIIAVKRKTKVEEPSYIDFKCNNCLEYDIPLCFVCKSAVSKKQNTVRQRCQIAHCNRYYHLDCLDHWPQTKLNAGETSKYKNEYVESITCPRHVCHTCVCDDPRGCKTRFSGDKLARCVRCPATYHTFTKCLPAGSKILTGSHIICPRHYEHRPGKVPCHVNTGWCFICALGGTLICCEYCPTSFHAECLNIDPPEGGYMCEDCETGRLPIYNEMVWVKLGHYRWWPGIILHPSEIPENIYSVKHSLGEFVVRFFGQYDHYWVNRGRVFPFQEGDSGRVSGQKSKLDAAFTTAMEHAQRACEIFKTAIPNDDETLDIASSLLPPHYVKLKVNKPLGSLIGRRVDIEESSLTPCDCNPLDPFPCGVYAQCLNRMLLTECGPSCLAGDRCNNRAFERREYPKMAPYHTQHRGWGLKTLEDIKAGQFVIEYVGELIDEEEFRRRMKRKHEIRDENFYFLTLDKERMIDAGPKGNLARFMNHCCEPNCETQKWTVLGDVRVGLFALYDIPANSELTFNYNLECAGIEKKRCLCGAKRCSGYMGAKPKQEEPGRKKTKVPAKRTYKKRKNTEESPSTAKPKNKVGRPPKPRELTDIEKDLLIIKNATNGLPSSDSESSGRILSVESEKNNRKALKRKRVSFSTEEAVFCDSPTLKKAKIDDVGD